MDDNTNFSTVRPAPSSSWRRTAAATAFVVLIAACGGEPAPENLAGAESSTTTSAEFTASAVDGQPQLAGELASGEAVSITASVPTTAAPSTTTSATPTTTTAIVVPVVLSPSEIDGAYEDERTNQRVLTAIDDPLNVRSGPGVGYEVVEVLEHETSGLDVTHSVNLDEDSSWRYIERNGQSIGWVHARYLFGHGATSTCQADPAFPTFEGAVIAGSGDLDLDGQSDEIFVLAESNEVGTSQAGFPVVQYDAWVLVSFANGGVATGQWDGYFDPVPTASINVFDLTTLNPANDFNEVVFTLGTGASHAQWGVMTLEGCEIVSTTFDGDAFSFSHGASAGHSTVGGCAYGPHGEIEFQVSSRNFNTGEWNNTTYQLEGAEWLELGSQQGTATGADDFPYASTLSDCAGFVG